MTAQHESEYDDWSRQWNARWQQAWRDRLEQGATAGLAGGAAAWSQPFLDWLDLGRDRHDAQARAVATRFVTQGRLFVDLAEAVARLLADAPAEGRSSEQWHDLLDRAFAALRQAIDDEADTARGGPFGSAQPLVDGWQELLSRVVARDRETAPDAGRGPWAGVAERLLERGDYLQAAGDYRARVLEAQRLAVDRFEELLAIRLAAGQGIGSVRLLYDLWVEAAEAAYAEVVATAPFATAQAALVHALCRTVQEVAVAQRAAAGGDPRPGDDRGHG